MNNDVIIAFCTFQFTFLCLDIYILLRTSSDIARKGENIWFRALVFTHMLYLVLNSVWSLNEYDLITISRPVLTAICTVSLWTVSNCAASFFLFVVEKLNVKKLISGPGVWLRLIPAIISTALIFSSPWTGLIFSLNENGYIVHGPLYILMVTFSSLYLLIVAAFAAENMLRQHTTFKRKANGALLGSVMVIILYILADGTLSKASILPAAVFAVILIIFIALQEANINSDALTGMNNRRRAEEYLSEALTGVSEANPVYLFVGDLDGFKKINDTYGHIEGDEALVICSRALKNATSRFDCFAARFGGDEFMIVWHPGKGIDADPEGLIRYVDEQLEGLSETKPYRIRITIGFVRCADSKIPLNAYFSFADEMLYRKKAALHAEERRG